MYKVIMRSGPVKYDFQGGFETEEQAIELAEEYNFRWIDENGFEWSLEIREYEEDIVETQEPYSIVIPNKEWAETFLEFIRNGDDLALNYLDDVFENTFDREQRLKYTVIRNLVAGLLHLNKVVIDMEFGCVEFNSQIDEAYRQLVNALIEIAEVSSNICKK